jgi:hypothetical protein
VIFLEQYNQVSGHGLQTGGAIDAGVNPVSQWLSYLTLLPSKSPPTPSSWLPVWLLPFELLPLGFRRITSQERRVRCQLKNWHYSPLWWVLALLWCYRWGLALSGQRYTSPPPDWALISILQEAWKASESFWTRWRIDTSPPTRRVDLLFIVRSAYSLYWLSYHTDFIMW